MAIYGIEGGLGSGKTLTGVWHLIDDMKKGKRIFSNVKLVNIPEKYLDQIFYLTKDSIRDMFDKVKSGEFNLKNSTIFVQEMHNYMDSRNSASKTNKVFSYFILQSRHAGEGSCDIIYDTQELTQADKRLRNNTDHRWRPRVYEWEKVNGKRKPKTVLIQGIYKLEHKWVSYNKLIDVSKVRDMYDTHELVDFHV